ncbi:hypothetical protein [Cupriavidus basilensis]|uniref:hypothetical protein n=1 Tax=Cupriavidus basilensis TaxID=68895 RepID=UPI0012E05BCA|nr:hypothetical protein [Cupriavidus basilensis]
MSTFPVRGPASFRSLSRRALAARAPSTVSAGRRQDRARPVPPVIRTLAFVAGAAAPLVIAAAVPGQA